ncbi:MAG: hypothetical protein HWD92_01105 [Flavobacteriia bacterium]|nr:hypothetical protein [Flavobacteriia bacterium]
MKRTLILGAIFLLSIVASAQPGNPSTPAPIDGSTVILIVAGGLLGMYAVIRSRRLARN